MIIMNKNYQLNNKNNQTKKNKNLMLNSCGVSVSDSRDDDFYYAADDYHHHLISYNT